MPLFLAISQSGLLFTGDDCYRIITNIQFLSIAAR